MANDGGGIDVRQLTAVTKDFEDLAREVGDFSDVLGKFFLAWARRVNDKWDQVKMGGGTFRGVVWKGVSPDYKRRPSGAPVTAEQILLKDTGNLRNSITENPTRLEKFELVVGPKGVPLKYAAAQNDVRSYAHWQIGVDDVVLKKLAMDKINAWCRRRGWRNPDR